MVGEGAQDTVSVKSPDQLQSRAVGCRRQFRHRAQTRYLQARGDFQQRQQYKISRRNARVGNLEVPRLQPQLAMTSRSRSRVRAAQRCSHRPVAAMRSLDAVQCASNAGGSARVRIAATALT